MSGPKVGASPMHRTFPWDSQPWLDLFHTALPHVRFLLRSLPAVLRVQASFASVVPIHPWGTHISFPWSRLTLRASCLGSASPRLSPASLGRCWSASLLPHRLLKAK